MRNTTSAEDTSVNLEAAASYGNRCRVAIDFYIATGNPAEQDYAYLNARWAARLALHEMQKADAAKALSMRILEAVKSGMTPVEALRLICGTEIVDTMIGDLYHELRKAVR